MSNCRLITEYPPLVRHKAELRLARTARRRRLAIGLVVTGLLVAAAASVSPALALLVAGISACALFFIALPGASSVDPGALAGIEGELAVLRKLQTLPDDYTLINRVKLPDPWLPNGMRELDFIVAGPTGVWIVEVKNTPGHVQVKPDARHWPLARRAGCGNRPCWSAIDNPLPQVTDQAGALKRWLLLEGLSVEPRPIVCLAHPEVAIEGGSDSPVPVLVPAQLSAHITQASPERPPAGFNAALDRLRAGAAVAKARSSFQIPVPE